MGTMAMSWKMRTPSADLPGGASISARSWRSLRTMAVLERETSIPMKTASRGVCPKARARKKVATPVMTTWREPPRITERQILTRLPRENSMPMEKRRRMTPTSARTSTSWTAWMMPSPWGPAMTPVRRKPRTRGSRARWERRITPRESPRMMATSERRGMVMPRPWPSSSATFLCMIPSRNQRCLFCGANSSATSFETSLRR